MTRQDGSDADIDEGAMAFRVAALVSRGLDRYSTGDLTGAMAEWEHALILVPDDPAATKYLQFVRDNFDLLEGQAQDARDAALAALESSSIPDGASLANGDEEYDEYEAFELTDPGEFADEASVDEGWALDDLPTAEPLPPAPGEMRDRLGHDLELLADGYTGVPTGEIGDGSTELAAAGEHLSEDRGATESDRADTTEYESTAAEVDFSELNSLLEDSGERAATDEGGEGPTTRAPAADVHRADTVDGSHIMADLARETVEDAPLDLDSFELGAAGGGAQALPRFKDDPAEELTVPGGDEPPPLPDRPALSDDALAAMEAAVQDMIDESAAAERHAEHHESDELDVGALGHLDGAAADDRAHGPDVYAPKITFHEVGTSEQTMPSRPSSSSLNAPNMDLGEAQQLMDEPFRIEETDGGDEATRERPTGWARGTAVDDDIDDDEKTRDHGYGDRGPSVQRAPTEDPELRQQAVIIDDSLLDDATSELPAVRSDDSGRLDSIDGLIQDDVLSDEDATREVHIGGERDEFPDSGRSRPISRVQHSGPEIDAVRADVVAAQLSTEIDMDAPADETEDQRTRRRVSALIERAGAEYEAEHYSTAVTALDLALDERPDSAISQKLIHSNRELLFRIFESYLGDDHAVPMVALPTHEISVQELDSRAAFLLSRIDGMLSFEEILDVAGMGKMEAYRHLCRLLLRGILEVR